MTLAELKQWQTDREKILAWCRAIGETDADCVDELLRNCENDPEARAFFVSKYEREARNV